MAKSEETPKKTAAGAKKTAAKKTAAKKAAVKKTATKSAVPKSKAPDATGKNLIIVESPAKARTIEKYLGKDFSVMASVGHVIDLPASKLGVDIENDFAPEYVVIKGKKSILNDLKKCAKSAKAVYLAPDPDREGEAIAYHIGQFIKDDNANIQRATFNEITRSAVQEAIANPRPINESLFKAQQARRVLDRLVGYKLSPLLWKKVRRGLSAGRVQSVAVRMVCDREREIQAFTPEEYWTIDGMVSAQLPPPFEIHLAKIDGKKAEVGNKELADKILDTVRGQAFTIGEVVKKEVSKRPFAPFITSTLQQEASRKLRMSARQTMRLAQRLYEGVDLGSQGSVGLITYMRTDSTRLSGEAIGQARRYIEQAFGANYLPEQPKVYTTKKSAQDAHEAIRPTDMSLSPDQVASYLEADELKLYTLIWRRTVACQMADAKLERTRIEIPVGPYLFVATGSIIKFDGYLKVYEEGKDEGGKTESDNTEGAEPVQLEGDETLPPVEPGQSLKLEQLKGNQHFTQPPARFTEAGLIRELERQGIGRPSTYAAIISTIQDKEYVNKEKGTFTPTELGFIITDLLLESFPTIMDIQFTAQMENKLDEVEEGSTDWVALLKDFYGPFEKRLEEAATAMRNVKAEVQETEYTCEKCGSPMVVRWGRNGKFLACSGFPQVPQHQAHR